MASPAFHYTPCTRFVSCNSCKPATNSFYTGYQKISPLAIYPFYKPLHPKFEMAYGIKSLPHLITKPIMKKTFLSLAAVLFTTGLVMAQQTEKKAPPPPPRPPAHEFSMTPPPPPPPVAQVEMVAPPPPPPPPQTINKNISVELNVFMKRNPQVQGLSWSDEGKTLRIQLRDGREESYDMNNAEEAQKAERLYGKLPAPPPPPPAPSTPPLPEKPVVRS
jgi:hypothetical protein